MIAQLNNSVEALEYKVEEISQKIKRNGNIGGRGGELRLIAGESRYPKETTKKKSVEYFKKFFQY